MKLDSFEDNRPEYKNLVDGVYKFELSKVNSNATKSGFTKYTLDLKVVDGEYKGSHAFPFLLSGWKNERGEGNDAAKLRKITRLIISQNLDSVKLKKFYKSIFSADFDTVQEFFEEILDSNILTGLEFEAKITVKKGVGTYTNSQGVEKPNPDTYSLSLSDAEEREAIEKINKALEE